MSLRARQNGGGKIRNAGGRGGGNGSPGGRGNSGGGSTVTFDTSPIGAYLTLSVGNTKATHTTVGGGSSTARVNSSKSSGKWYIEFLMEVDTGVASLGVGLIPTNYNFSTYVGGPNLGGGQSWGYYSNGSKYTNGLPTAYGSTYTSGDVISIAWDADSGKLWFAKNNVWQASGDPAAGTNQTYTVSGTYYPAAECYAQTTAITVRSPNNYSYSPPSGFSPWQA